MKANELPILTAAESEVMDALWDLGSATVREVAEQLPGGRAYNTVLTLLRILERKGYARHVPHPEQARTHLYSAAVAQRQARRQHARDLVRRLFGGRTPALVAGLIEDEQLSREELEQLRATIEGKLATERRKTKKR